LADYAGTPLTPNISRYFQRHYAGFHCFHAIDIIVIDIGY